MDDKEGYAKLGAALKPALGGGLSLLHVAFKPIAVPLDHLNASISEFAIQTLQEGKTSAELEGLLQNPQINGEGKTFVTGKVVEKDNQYVLLKGWDSVEVSTPIGLVS